MIVCRLPSSLWFTVWIKSEKKSALPIKNIGFTDYLFIFVNTDKMNDKMQELMKKRIYSSFASTQIM